MAKIRTAWLIKCCVRIAVSVLFAVLSTSITACDQTEQPGNVADETDGNTDGTSNDDGGISSDDCGDCPEGPRVDRLAVVDADTAELLHAFEGDTVIDLADWPNRRISLVAEPDLGHSGSMLLTLDGDDRIENAPPYGFFGDGQGKLTPWAAEVGEYTISAVAYTEDDLQGDAGPPMEAVLEVIHTLDPNPDPMVGDPGWRFDEARYDPSFPDMKHWAQAGVRGGIPYRSNTPIVATLHPGDDINSAIKSTASAGGGVVLLTAGSYPITKPINMASKVILRGENRDTTRIEVHMRQKWHGWGNFKYALLLNGVERAGIEDLTIKFIVEGCEPYDTEDFMHPWREFYRNDKGVCDGKVVTTGMDDLYVGLVSIGKGSSDVWVDNCALLESGTLPIHVESSTSHVTLRGNYVHRCYNKGGGGNCYYSLRGSYILSVYETVLRIRHITVEQGAKYTVLYKVVSEVDINFHQNDQGHNLIEQCKVSTPGYHWTNVFCTGAKDYGHGPPGPGNVFYNNDTNYRNQGQPWSGPDKVYTFFTYGDPVVLSETPPSGGTLYAVVRE